MYYTIYKITNLVNGKIYIGAHQTNNLNDDYMGSGYLIKYAIKKYGLECFDKEILFHCETKEEMFEQEREIVTEEFVKLKTNYNIRAGGRGGWTVEQQILNNKKSQIARKILRESNPEWFQQSQVKWSKALKSQYEQGSRQVNVKPHIVGEFKHTEHTKQHISNVLKQMKYGVGEKNSQFGTCWIYSNINQQSLKIPKELLSQYESDGWIKGRKMKFN